MDVYQVKSVCELLNEQVFETVVFTPEDLEDVLNNSQTEQDVIQHLIYLAPKHGKSHRVYSIVKAFDWDLEMGI